jgi:DNA polymerase III subunit beta
VLSDVDDILSWLDDADPVKPAASFKSAKTNTLTAPETAGPSFEINREVLLSLLTIAIPVVPTRDMVPVLLNFKFKIEQDLLTISASSLKMDVVLTTNQFECKNPGVALIPAKTFITMVKEAAIGISLFVEFNSRSAVFVAGGFSAEISLTNGKFPEIESTESIEFHTVNRAMFVDAINTVKYALPGKEFSGQDSLQTINIKSGKFIAFDGARFQQVKIPQFRLSMQLASSGIANLLKFLTASDMEELEIGETERKLIFRLGTKTLYVTKLGVTYPNVEQLWLRPALANDQEFIVDKQELITAIKQVKIAADSNAIGLVISESNVTITARDINSMSATAVIGCKWAKKPRTVVVNYLHLAEMLKAYQPQECRFLLGEDTANYKGPILLKDDDALAIATIAQLPAYRAGLTGN